MKITLAPDSFKGTFSSKECIEILKEELINYEVYSFPFSDGGEGFLDYICNDSQNYKTNYLTVTGPDKDQKINTYYKSKANVAYIESAKIIGLNLSKIHNPLYTSSYGLGEVILDGLNKGIKTFNIGLGGTATNDIGAGMLSVLGVKFFNYSDNVFVPTGLTLAKVKDLVLDKFNFNINKSIFNLYCDVTNPLYGKNGASYVFARQKGANDKEIKLLDDNAKYFSSIVNKKIHKDYSSYNGSGAAGGLTYAFLSFFKNVNFKDSLTDELAEKIKLSDLVITGEGKLDSQSFQGKVVSKILGICKKNKKKVLIICGVLDKSASPYLKDYQDVFVLPINLRERDKTYSNNQAKEDLRLVFKKYLKSNYCLIH